MYLALVRAKDENLIHVKQITDRNFSRTTRSGREESRLPWDDDRSALDHRRVNTLKSRGWQRTPDTPQ
jgi:hypothetical protein